MHSNCVPLNERDFNSFFFCQMCSRLSEKKKFIFLNIFRRKKESLSQTLQSFIWFKMLRPQVTLHTKPLMYSLPKEAHSQPLHVQWKENPECIGVLCLSVSVGSVRYFLLLLMVWFGFFFPQNNRLCGNKETGIFQQLKWNSLKGGCYVMGERKMIFNLIQVCGLVK